MRRGHPGFTLLELLVGVTITFTVLTAVYTAFLTNQTTFSRGKNNIEVQQNARLAMELLTRDIRMVGYDPSGVLAGCAQPTALQVGGANTLTFLADVTDTGVTDKVTYRVSGTQILRDLAPSSGAPCLWGPATSSVVADDGAALTFAYFDGANTPIPAPVGTASLGSVRRITLGVTTTGVAKGTAAVRATYPLTLDVRLRNLP